MTTKNSKKQANQAGENVALICGASEDGSQIALLRKRNDRVEAGIARKLEEGKPIHGEVVQLRPRENSLLCDVETVYQSPEAPETTPSAASPRSGGEHRGHPAQVASDTYRSGWDAIWSRTSREKLLN